MRALFPTRALALLLAIGLLDLVATVILHVHGLIEERNPLMAPLLAQGWMGFALVKSATLAVGWFLLARADVRQARWPCLMGSAGYVTLLTLAFTS